MIAPKDEHLWASASTLAGHPGQRVHPPRLQEAHRMGWCGDTGNAVLKFRKSRISPQKALTCSTNLPIPVLVTPRPPKTWTASRAVSWAHCVE
jgi:hypothetical protein